MHAVLTGTGIDIKNQSRSCCAGRPRPLFVPYYNVLSATPVPGPAPAVRITFVHPTAPHRLESVLAEVRRPRTSLEHDSEALTVCDSDASIFGDAPIRRRRLFVVVNPHGGPGNADKLFSKYCRPVFDAAGAECSVNYTTYGGHARDMAKETDFEGFDAIVCVSGDGIPHEILNGLMERGDDTVQRVPVCQLPGGSGNAMSHSLVGSDSMTLGCLNILKGPTYKSDLMYITQGTNHSYSFLSQSFGVVADCDLGTENMRWMGPARFTVGVVLKTLGASRYPCKIAYKRAPSGSGNGAPRTPQYGTVQDEIPGDWSKEVHPDLAMFYVGKMPYMSVDTLVFPHADATDGAMDMILWDTTVGTVRGLQLLDKMSRGEHVNEKDVRYEKVVAYRLMPEGTGFISVDGESYLFEPIQVEVLSEGCLFVGEYAHRPA